jgi:hypothetical protein
MSHRARSLVATATRPNRILVFLAVVWMAAAIAIGALFTSQPAADGSASRATSGAVASVQL